MPNRFDQRGTLLPRSFLVDHRPRILHLAGRRNREPRALVERALGLARLCCAVPAPGAAPTSLAQLFRPQLLRVRLSMIAREASALQLPVEQHEGLHPSLSRLPEALRAVRGCTGRSPRERTLFGTRSSLGQSKRRPTRSPACRGGRSPLADLPTPRFSRVLPFHGLSDFEWPGHERNEGNVLRNSSQ